MVNPYRGFSVKHYSFSVVQMVENRCNQLLLARALFGRERNDKLIVAQTQRLANLGKIRLDLARFELVELVRHVTTGQPVCTK